MQRNMVDLSPASLENLKRLFIFRDVPDQMLKNCIKKIGEPHLLKDEILFRSGESYHKGIYFLISGAIHLTSENDFIELSPGDTVGLTTFLGKTMYRLSSVAGADSDLLFIDEYSIYSLMDKSPGFRDKFMKLTVERLNNLERLSFRMMSLAVYQSVGGCMSSPLITLHNSKSVEDAAKLMQEHNVGALVIMNRKHVLKGLLTTKHLTHNYLSNATELPNKALAEDYANSNPLMLPQEYPLVETLSEMLRRNEDYALITRKNRPAGIISKSDIMELLANRSDVFGASVSKANSIEELKAIVCTLPKILENMMNNTSLFRELLPTLSSNHIIIQKRAFELAKEEYKMKQGFELLTGQYCFLSTDMLARREMTLSMQQSHILVLGEKISARERKHYMDFSALFSAMLEKLGYERNPMGVYLNNPFVIKGVNEWKDFISTSIHKSNDSNIPFTRAILDCEKFEGDELLSWELKDVIFDTVKEKTLFFGRLMNYQSMAKIPISQFGSFITEKNGELEGTIDLKANAMDFISYTAQAFSINSDNLDNNTVRRLDQMLRKKTIDENFIRETISVYESLVDLALHEQLNQVRAGEKPTYRITPSHLSMHSQERLKRALNMAARFFGEGFAYFR